MKKALIIGCGLVGSVIARYLAEECNYRVSVWDRRNHIAGNLYDYIDEHGILVQKYGPHIFHTYNETIYDYVCRFASWEPYNLVCGAVIDNICTPTAFNFKSIDLFYPKEEAREIKEHIKSMYGDREFATVIELLECSDPVIQKYAQFLYDKDYSLYTAKQWGISPSEIDKSVLKRVPIRFSYDEAYFKDPFQALPREGYTAFVRNILNHPQISIELDTEATGRISIINNVLHVDGTAVDYPIIYTGPLDYFFSFTEGFLPYRSLRFEWKYDNLDSFQELPVIAYPQADGFTRITEYKKLPVQHVAGTSYAVEYPIPYHAECSDSEPYYPVLTDASQILYRQYYEKASQIQNLYLCGRLADYKYYDMDKAIERALAFCHDNFERKSKETNE